jgi:hypothetical protein
MVRLATQRAIYGNLGLELTPTRKRSFRMSLPKKSPSRSVESSKRSAPVVQPAAPFVKERHELECRIQRALQAYPGLKFSRLVVHQCPQGVCLEGSLETNDAEIDLCELVNKIAGVQAINRVVKQSPK